MDAFAALADRTRRNIVEALAAGEQGFGELADRFEMSRPAVSQHLKVLKEAGLVSVRAKAQRRIYRLDDNALGEIERWLERVRQFWNPRLDELARVLREEDRGDERIR